MEELLQQLFEQTGIPVEMLDRAARARSTAKGITPEAVVAGWAGVEIPAESASPATSPVVEAPAAETVSVELEDAPISVEVLEPEAEPPELAIEPESVDVGPGVHRWLTAAFVVVPFIAILYALIAPNGPDCGNAGRLAIDPVTGKAVNCDGSEFGAAGLDFFSVGQALYEANCVACHGTTGGGGAGPALAGGSVVATFSACVDHIEWVALGSVAWSEGTYGDQSKPVSGGMPGFAMSFTAEELASVVLYERVAFGGESISVAEAGCGFVEPAVMLDY